MHELIGHVDMSSIWNSRPTFCFTRLDRNCRGNLSIRSAQYQFIALLGLVVCICVVLEVLFSSPVSIKQPVPIHPTFYLTSECGYGRRLGNVMFTFAATLGIAQRNNMTPVIERKTVLLDAFKNIDVALSDDMRNTMLGSTRLDYREFGGRGSAYDRHTVNLFKTVNRTNVQLLGYFQSWRYFDNVADVVRKSFIFKESIAARADDFLRAAVPTQWHNGKVEYVRVGVHVRRGDMVTDYYRNYGYTVAPSEYFIRAMELFVKQYSKVQFIVCSDDMGWSQANIPVGQHFGNFVDVTFSKGHSVFEDLAILTRCDHILMSVGSFGWWAAWLVNGTTVYYDKWPRPFSMLEYHVQKTDYFPPHWIKMS